MPRLVQSSLVPGSATSWLDLLRDESRTVALATSTPTLTMRIIQGHDASWVRHELLSGFFRTSWTSRIGLLDLDAGRFVAESEGTIFLKFRHEMAWEASSEGLSIRSEISWEGARPSLERMLDQAILRFPLAAGQAPSFAESPTRRMILDERAFNAA